MKKAGGGFRPRTIKRVNTAYRQDELHGDVSSHTQGTETLREHLLPHDAQEVPYEEPELAQDSALHFRERADSRRPSTSRRMTFGRMTRARNPNAPNIEHAAALPRISAGPESQENSGQVFTWPTLCDFSASAFSLKEIFQLKDIPTKTDAATVRWIRISQASPIFEEVAAHLNIHPVAIEEARASAQRPRVEFYGADTAHILFRCLSATDGQLQDSQLSIFVCPNNTIMTLETGRSSLLTGITERLNRPGSRLRVGMSGALLTYCIIEAAVDGCFPFLEMYGDRLEDLEQGIIAKASNSLIKEVHMVKREMLLIRRLVWPLKELLSEIENTPSSHFPESTRPVLRHIIEHTSQVMDVTETYRDVGSGLLDLYTSSTQLDLDNILKVLTLVQVTFLPLTFMAGVFGMNFQNGMVVLNWEHGYVLFWALCGFFVVALLTFFRWKRWL